MKCWHLSRRIGVAALIALLAMPVVSNASLVGDSVDGSLSSNVSTLVVTTPFTSPAVVGSGVEFAGVMTHVGFDLIWDIFVDVGASSFSVALQERNKSGNGNLANTNFGLFLISLSDLDWIGTAGVISGVVLNNYSCSSSGVSCTVSGGGPDVDVLTFSDHAISFGSNYMRHGEVYTFDIVTTNRVPEPSTLMLLAMGLVAVAGTRRRRVTV